MRKLVRNGLLSLQNELSEQLSSSDDKAPFKTFDWNQSAGSSGISKIIEGGEHIEYGALSFSEVKAVCKPQLMKELKLLPHADGSMPHFFSTSLSVVMHPQSPMMPIMHMNLRYFESFFPDQADDTDNLWWFGGCMDLTPHYVSEADAKFFHEQLKSRCDLHDPGSYQKFKAAADEYFYLRHREESLGIGGIYFDQLTEEYGQQRESRWNFIKSIGKAYFPIYGELFERNKKRQYGTNEKQWQLLRRGRFVEFNLIYDRRTKFVIQTDRKGSQGLMALPPTAKWNYHFEVMHDSEEAKTLAVLKSQQNWI
ncbi:MAG TPA: coproporphyrinogen III oxidase [Cyclobacteriaceae bacterium]|nr:coproporphyrinogen III oxidase [Cyclobacteriaceae bacterium]